MKKYNPAGNNDNWSEQIVKQQNFTETFTTMEVPCMCSAQGPSVSGNISEHWQFGSF